MLSGMDGVVCGMIRCSLVGLIGSLIVFGVCVGVVWGIVGI